MKTFSAEKWKEYALAIFSSVIVVIWSALSIKSFNLIDSSGFQRLGSVLIAGNIISFAFTRRAERVLDSGIESYPRPKVREILQYIEFWEKFWPDRLPSDVGEMEREKIGNWISAKKSIEFVFDNYARIENFLFYLRATEIALLVAGTLQWGYGDLATCYFHGAGWQPC